MSYEEKYQKYKRRYCAFHKKGHVRGCRSTEVPEGHTGQHDAECHLEALRGKKRRSRCGLVDTEGYMSRVRVLRYMDALWQRFQEEEGRQGLLEDTNFGKQIRGGDLYYWKSPHKVFIGLRPMGKLSSRYVEEGGRRQYRVGLPVGVGSGSGGGLHEVAFHADKFTGMVLDGDEAYHFATWKNEHAEEENQLQRYRGKALPQKAPPQRVPPAESGEPRTLPTQITKACGELKMWLREHAKNPYLPRGYIYEHILEQLTQMPLQFSRVFGEVLDGGQDYELLIGLYQGGTTYVTTTLERIAKLLGKTKGQNPWIWEQYGQGKVVLDRTTARDLVGIRYPMPSPDQSVDSSAVEYVHLDAERVEQEAIGIRTFTDHKAKMAYRAYA